MPETWLCWLGMVPRAVVLNKSVWLPTWLVLRLQQVRSVEIKLALLSANWKRRTRLAVFLLLMFLKHSTESSIAQKIVWRLHLIGERNQHVARHRSEVECGLNRRYYHHTGKGGFNQCLESSLPSSVRRIKKGA